MEIVMKKIISSMLCVLLGSNAFASYPTFESESRRRFPEVWDFYDGKIDKTKLKSAYDNVKSPDDRRDSFIALIEKGDQKATEIIGLFIDWGYKLSIDLEEGLNKAVRDGNLPVVKLLLEKNANRDEKVVAMAKNLASTKKEPVYQDILKELTKSDTMVCNTRKDVRDFPWIKFCTFPKDEEHIAACFKYGATTREDDECRSTGKNCACWVDIGPNVETNALVCGNPKEKPNYLEIITKPPSKFSTSSVLFSKCLPKGFYYAGPTVIDKKVTTDEKGKKVIEYTINYRMTPYGEGKRTYKILGG